MADITLISGSTLGSAEYVAEHLAEKLNEQGFSTDVFHGPDLATLNSQESYNNKRTWLVVTSTHGAGELPDNLQPLFEQIERQQPDLSQVQFGAIGLGSSEYDIFCGGIKNAEQILIKNGAKKIGSRLEIDITQYEIPEDPAELWLTNWLKLFNL